MKRRAVFLDRDGTINVEKGYLYRIADFEFLPGVIEALQMLQKAEYQLIVVTNQSGIARGYYTEDDLAVLHKWMQERLSEAGVSLSGIYYCPHHPQASIERYRVGCDCRKPQIGLFIKAARELRVGFDGSYVVGDKLRDCAICESEPCHGFLIGEYETADKLEQVRRGEVPRVHYAKNLYECAQMICAGSIPKNV